MQARDSLRNANWSVSMFDQRIEFMTYVHSRGIEQMMHSLVLRCWMTWRQELSSGFARDLGAEDINQL